MCKTVYKRTIEKVKSNTAILNDSHKKNILNFSRPSLSISIYFYYDINMFNI